ncbi:COX15/CtaA family protein [Sphingomonas baiyangensis]|uniref:Heme A synthase n=1 Tax=Sphingomonas baiyangensis TaxID=2572576 RepID=A0A4U1L7V1_9SPHN|nr:COX15/CtaA family protein [Sphingomonas baiyangensis]TKD52834.1 heme A synthase [Sphingomonas baiyangensis]
MTGTTFAAPRSTAVSPRARPRAIAAWLWSIAALIVLMVAVGGITRLTESGLSITEWKPVSGAIPPLNAADWQAEFVKYQATPEYREINRGMSLAEFKFIYFWEWFHRLLGRLIGIAFALPLAWFALRRAIPPGYGARLTALLALGGLQGVIGWWMVTSGLAERTDVSHFRLAVHLNLALAILAVTVWTALDMRALARDPAAAPARIVPVAWVAGGVLLVQLLFGAFVAGLNAGLVTNEWPLMNGRLVPAIDTAGGLGNALVNDPWALHFIHRWWAFAAFVALMFLARAARRTGARGASIAIHLAVGTQILLGIATVMSGVQFHAALTHQIVGALLVAATAWGAHAAGRVRA